MGEQHDPTLLEYRVQELENALLTRYMDKYQMQNEYLNRLENERMIRKSTEISWWVAAGGIIVALSTVGTLVITVIQALTGH